jgi:hypothetical protein
MTNGSAGYIFLGIPERLAQVLWRTVQDFEQSLAGREDRPWAQLTSVALSRCVLHFACLHRQLGPTDVYPEVTCADLFRQYAEQLMQDATACEWGVPRHMVAVVSGTVAACGSLVLERLHPPE